MLDLAGQILGASRLGQETNLLICKDRSRVFTDVGAEVACPRKLGRASGFRSPIELV